MLKKEKREPKPPNDISVLPNYAQL